jgi:tetratricopeptide (TPR) repeat protein
MNRGRNKIILLPTPLAILGLAAAGWFLMWPQWLLREAQHGIAANDLDGAESNLRGLTRHSPKNAKGWFLLAQVLRRHQRHIEAEDALRQALKLGYPEREGQRELALNEAAIQFRPPIAVTLKKFLEENPNDLDLLEALARGHASTRDWQKTDRYFTHLIELQPEKVEWYWERGQTRQDAAYESGGGHTLASDDFREVVRRVPDHLEARLRLAQCLLSNAKMAEAKVELQRCRELDPRRAEPLIGLANCALEEQDWDQAHALLTQALERKWNSLIALAMKGDLHLRRQQYAEAIPYFQKILVLDPTNKAAHLKLAQAFRSSGKLLEAKDQENAFQRLQQMEERNANGPG